MMASAIFQFGLLTRDKDICFHLKHSLSKLKRRQTWYFSYFSQKIGFDISCKLSPQSLFSWKHKKNISKCHLLKFLPRVLSIKIRATLLLTIFNLITAHTPISAQSRNSVVFRLQPVYFFLYFFTKAYVVGTHLNCIDKSMQFKWVPTTYAFVKKVRKNRIVIIK